MSGLRPFYKEDGIWKCSACHWEVWSRRNGCDHCNGEEVEDEESEEADDCDDTEEDDDEDDDIPDDAEFTEEGYLKDGFLVGKSRVLPGASDSNKDKGPARGPARRRLALRELRKAKENRIATRQGPLSLTQENLDFHSKLPAPVTPNQGRGTTPPNQLWGEGRVLGGATAAQNATTPAAKREAALRAAEQRFAAQRREAAETPAKEPAEPAEKRRKIGTGDDK